MILDSQPMIAKCSHGDAGTEGQTSIVCDNQCSNRIIDRHVVVSEVGQIDVTRSLWIQSDIAGDKPAQHNWRQGRRVPQFFREDRVDTGCPGVAPFFLCKVEAPRSDCLKHAVAAAGPLTMALADGHRAKHNVFIAIGALACGGVSWVSGR